MNKKKTHAHRHTTQTRTLPGGFRLKGTESPRNSCNTCGISVAGLCCVFQTSTCHEGKHRTVKHDGTTGGTPTGQLVHWVRPYAKNDLQKPYQARSKVTRHDSPARFKGLAAFHRRGGESCDCLRQNKSPRRLQRNPPTPPALKNQQLKKQNNTSVTFREINSSQKLRSVHGLGALDPIPETLPIIE